MPQNCKRNKVEHTIINKNKDRPHFPKKKDAGKVFENCLGKEADRKTQKRKNKNGIRPVA